MKQILALLWIGSLALTLQAGEVVNDVTLLNPIAVDRVIVPHSIAEIVAAIKTAPGGVSIGGARHSQGGQIAEAHSLFLDMRQFNQVVAFDPTAKTITVQAGITWRDIQEKIDPYGLSVAIMQTYSNFTVGGSLSVNCHGRYVAAGPLILAVKRIKVVLAGGSVVEATPESHQDIFDSVIGGYGGIGVIVEATLQLTTNTKVERHDRVMAISQYRDYFLSQVRDSPTAVFHNADIYPPKLDRVRAVTWSVTDQPVTNSNRLIGRRENYWTHRRMIWLISRMPWGKQLRQYVVDPLLYLSHPVVWRNHEASYDVAELEPNSRKYTTYVLQEYFVPVDRFDDFYPKIAAVLTRRHVNVLNISIRYARADPGSLLAWAKTDVFAFVLYYEQGTAEPDKLAVAQWTRELIDAVLSENGSYYLPYQIHATPDQFQRAYPRANEFFALKQKFDPTDKFRNQLWDAYYPASAAGPLPPNR
jgi:FAD/FMN-containing dehydrogenase